MDATHHDTAEFRQARFHHADLSGVVFRDCDLDGVRIVDCFLGDAVVSGEIERLVVNDVDVTGFVRDQLDLRQPERRLVRELGTVRSHQDTWAAVERMWATTHERLRGLPAAMVTTRVEDEWSAVETLRHLVFATDAWAARMILGHERPYHPAGLPADGYPAEEADRLGLEPAREPTLAEMLEVRSERMALVRGIVADLTEQQLDEVYGRLPAPTYPEQPRTCARCLRVIMNEEVEHHRYLVRDLAVLSG